MPGRTPEDVEPIEVIHDGTDDSEEILGSWHNDDIFGDGGDDWLFGLGGLDDIFGGRGNDHLVGGADNDTLDGGENDDWLEGGSGADVVNGGTGNDTAAYGGLRGVVVNLDTGEASGGDAEGDTLIGIENLRGTTWSDTLTGDANRNVLDGGDHGDDTLKGGDGDDRLVGGPGADVLDGGTGNDIADYSTSRFGVEIKLGAGRGWDGDAEEDTLINVEDVYGSRHDDVLWGDANCNVLHGNDGNDELAGAGFDDVLWGDAGDDHLVGGAGNDHLHGGSGDDTFYFPGSGDDTIYDFVAGGTEDRLDLSLAVQNSLPGYRFSSFQEVLAHTTMVNGNAVIDLGGDHSVILIGVSFASLTAADFIF